MAELYEKFPEIENSKIIIRKMADSDAEALFEISHSDAVYRYISVFLRHKSLSFLRTAIKNLGSRDFENKKMIIAGIYLKEAPDRLVGLAEIFDYKKKLNIVTIGYRIHEAYWNQGIATSAIGLMIKYLSEEIGIKNIQAYVMPENIYSSRALLRNGFAKENEMVQKRNWGGQEVVDVEVYSYKQGDLDSFAFRAPYE